MKRNIFSEKGRNLLFISFFMMLGLCVQAQVQEYSGIVLGENQQPLKDATVQIVNNSTVGVLTQVDGRFTISAKKGQQLRISYTGYDVKKVLLGEERNLNTIILTLSDTLLTEVVVTGYGGKQLRRKNTNSIAIIGSETFSKGVFSNPAQALSGAVAGVRVVQASGDPGAAPRIILRGGTNFDGSGSPLIIVDGMVRPSLSDINPEDIGSMEVMKDAGATAIYGARANNGVILITTKTGKAGVATLDVKTRYGMNYLNNPYKFMDAEGYLYWMRNAYKNASKYFQRANGDWVGTTDMASLKTAVAYGTGNIYFTKDANGNLVPANGNVDSRAVWSPMIYKNELSFLLNQGWRTMKDPVYGDTILFKDWDMAKHNTVSPAYTKDVNMGFSGGNEKGHYYSNVGFNNADGAALDNTYQRLTFTLNADYKVKSWLTSYSNVSFQDAKWKGLPPTQTDEGNYFARMFSAPPTMRGYAPDGTLLLGQNSGDGNQAVNLDKFIRRNNTDKITFGQAFNIAFTKNLSLRTTANWLYSEEFYEAFNKDYLNSVNNYDRARKSSASFERDLSQTYNSVLNYNQTFNSHTINGLIGAEFYDRYDKGFSAMGSGAPTDDFMDLEYTSSEKDKRTIDSWHRRQSIMSYFARFNYDYQSKYLLSLVARRDGYSRLLGDNRWGIFPGVSTGWIFSSESFTNILKEKVKLSFGKLRLSYGVNGNVSDEFIGPYTLQGSYTSARYNGNVGNLLNNLPNPGLRWEKSNTFEAGVDLNFFNNRLTTAWTYYNRLTSDKYAKITLPSHVGVGSYLSNNGQIRNKGFEFEVNYQVVNNKDWQWKLGLNGSYNKNIIVKLPNNGLERNRQDAFQVYSGAGNELVWVGGYQEGQEPGVLYAYLAEGIYKSYDEIPGKLIDKYSGIYLYGPDAWANLSESDKVKSNGKAKALPIQPGDVKWKDVNGDGVIDQFDRVKIGNTTPRWTGGFTSSVSWKGFTLSARLDYALGFYISDTRAPWIMGAAQGTFSTLVDTKDSWTPENPNAKFPTYAWADQLGKNNYSRSSSMFMYKGDYLAFREIFLSYALPKSISDKLRMQRFELSVTGQNLGYLTQGKNIYSPERSSFGGYPLPRTIIFGLSVSF